MKESTTRLTDEQFRMLLDLTMVTDPWPLGPDENDILIAFITEQSEAFGYNDWVEAYHRFQP